MSAWRAIRLAARREILERVRSRTYRASTAAMILLVVGIVVVVGLTGSDDGERFDLGVTGPGATAVAEEAAAQASAFGVEVELRSLESEAEAEAAVADDELDAAIVSEDRAIAGQSPSDQLLSLLQVASRQVRGAERLGAEGVPDDAIRAALDPPPVEVTSVGEAGGDEGLALLGGVLLYIAIVIGGLAVSQGVVEEKGSRVIELLLSAVRPVQLLAGKVLGIGLVGLVQLIAIAGSGIAVALVTGVVDLPESTLRTAVLAVVFFVLGYLLYACAFAVAGALVSRQEDLQGSTSLLTMVLVAGYIASIVSIDQPSAPLAVIASFVPPSAPLVVPVRAAQDALPGWELAASIAVLVASVALLLWAATRIYERAVLRMGAPMKLTEALRLVR